MLNPPTKYEDLMPIRFLSYELQHLPLDTLEQVEC